MSLSIELSEPNIEVHWHAVNNDILHLDYMVFKCNSDKRVQNGPFAGMKLCPEPTWTDGNLCLKLLGYYEHELHAVIEKAIARQPKTIINVGCAEGYYAVGLGMRLPRAKVFAADISSHITWLCSDAGAANGVNPDRMICFLAGYNIELTAEFPCLTVIDNEGAEEQTVKDLMQLQSDFIIECHDFLQPGISARITQLLAASHNVERITPKPLTDVGVNVNAVTDLKLNTALLQNVLLTEKRNMDCCWLACWRK